MSPLSSAIIDTWRRFYRDPLAVIGAIALIIIILAVLFGPIFYRVPIDTIDFSQTTAPPSLKHLLALMIWARINWRGFWWGVEFP